MFFSCFIHWRQLLRLHVFGDRWIDVEHWSEVRPEKNRPNADFVTYEVSWFWDLRHKRSENNYLGHGMAQTRINA
jgi:hypothetical protein